MFDCAVIQKLLSAIVDFNTCLSAQEFVMTRFVAVLKATPATYVVHQDRLESRRALHDLCKQGSQSRAMLQCDACSPRILKRPHDLEAVQTGVAFDNFGLIFDGVYLRVT